MYGLENVGIGLEIIGFILLLRDYMLRCILYLVKAYKKELGKPLQPGMVGTELGFLDFGTYSSTHRKYQNIQDASIIIIVLGLFLQFNIQ